MTICASDDGYFEVVLKGLISLAEGFTMIGPVSWADEFAVAAESHKVFGGTAYLIRVIVVEYRCPAR